jgi:hypothetical protein
MFKKEQGLKRWSQKRFNEWVSENVDALVRIAGLSSSEEE